MIKNKIFRFELKKENDLSNSPEVYCNIVQCGKNKFTIKNYEGMQGHEELAFNCDLYCNNIFICHAHNDGNGGMTDLWTDSKIEQIRMQNVQKQVSRYKWKYGTMEFELDLDFIASTLACSASYGKC